MTGNSEEQALFRSFFKRSLTRNLILIIGLAVTLILVSSLLIHLLLIARTNSQQFEHKKKELISNLTETLELPLWNYDTQSVQRLGQIMMTTDIVALLIIKDTKDRVLFSGRDAAPFNDRSVSFDIFYRDVHVGSFDIGLTDKTYRSAKQRLIMISLSTLGALILCIFMVVVVSVRWFMKRPLMDFSQSIDSLANGEYRTDLKAEQYAELEELTQHFNRMSSKIQSREKDLIRFATIIEQADEEVIITDPDGRIQYVNPSFEQNTGFGSEEVLGKTPAILKSGVHDTGFYQTLWQTILNKQTWKGLIQNRNKSGDLCTHDTTITPILDFDDNITAFVSIRRDITQQIRMEQQVQQSMKMQAIGTLAGGIAHDFNNILSGIFGYCQLAQTKINDPDKANSYIDNALRAARRATHLVNQILTFSRQTEYEKRPFQIYLEVNEALKLLRSSIPVTITIEKCLESRSLVMADPGKIHQVVMNLCTNAYHAMRRTGGTLSVFLKEETLPYPRQVRNRVMPAARYLVLGIGDTGHGMDQKTLVSAFEPYFTTKKVGQGTGLGLAIVQAIVDEHDGFIDVESSFEKGTLFKLYFPVVETDALSDSLAEYGDDRESN
ncbi:MAG: PAS domain S-box protein, partial [Desulfobacteraceae bacterium]